MPSSTVTFFDIPPGSHEETPFTPRLPDGREGIRIAAPPIVEMPAKNDGARLGTYVPVAMTHRFRISYGRRFDYMAAHMTVCAVDAATGESLCSSLQEDDYIPTGPDLTPVPPDQDNLSESHLQFDLARFVALPAREARYHVHVSLEKYQSNTVTIEVVHAR